MNAQTSFLLAGFIAGFYALLNGIFALSPNLTPEDRAFARGMVVSAAALGAVFFFLSVAIKN